MNMGSWNFEHGIPESFFHIESNLALSWIKVEDDAKLDFMIVG